jgi:hypothetical protein
MSTQQQYIFIIIAVPVALCVNTYMYTHRGPVGLSGVYTRAHGRPNKGASAAPARVVAEKG